MPHIRAIFLDSQLEIKFILWEHKEEIRKVVAECTGYELSEIALIPEIISTENEKFSDNILPLELVIDAGIKVQGKTEETNHRIVDGLKKISPLRQMKFGVWLRCIPDNSFKLVSS